MTEESIQRELGGIGQALRDIQRRLEDLEEKTNKFGDMAADFKHMKNNVAMMKEPIEDYKNMKQRGVGAWTLITLLAGAFTVCFNVISYLVRAYVLGIGTP